MKPEFLTIEDVLRIHEIELARFGGMTGVRDHALLESALAQPGAAFGGEFLHVDLFSMAAAYLFHIVKNHPFLDGNKRTGLIIAITFLAINGVSIPSDSGSLYEMTIGVAEGRIGKEELIDLVREIATLAP